MARFRFVQCLDWGCSPVLLSPVTRTGPEPNRTGWGLCGVARTASARFRLPRHRFRCCKSAGRIRINLAESRRARIRPAAISFLTDRGVASRCSASLSSEITNNLYVLGLVNSLFNADALCKLPCQFFAPQTRQVRRPDPDLSRASLKSDDDNRSGKTLLSPRRSLTLKTTANPKLSNKWAINHSVKEPLNATDANLYPATCLRTLLAV